MVLTSALKVSAPEDEEETLMKVEMVPWPLSRYNQIMDDEALLVDEEMMPEYYDDEDDMIGLKPITPGPQTGRGSSVDLTPTEDTNTSPETTFSSLGNKWIHTPMSGAV